jgi:L-histidine N-alpha-methyltransferase
VSGPERPGNPFPISAKFRRDGIAAELAAAGLAMRSWWTDAAGQYGLSLTQPS